jgi:hypothetical protein
MTATPHPSAKFSKAKGKQMMPTAVLDRASDQRYRVAFLLLVLCTAACRPASVQTVDPWQYPLRFGDTRAKVRRLLTYPQRQTPFLEEFSHSGVTVWYDAERVSKFSFSGKAARLYSSDLGSPLIAEQPVLLALTGYSDEMAFRRALGNPVSNTDVRIHASRERRCFWKASGYVIEAWFLVDERNDANRRYPPGTLISFEVERGM